MTSPYSPGNLSTHLRWLETKGAPVANPAIDDDTPCDDGAYVAYSIADNHDITGLLANALTLSGNNAMVKDLIAEALKATSKL
jgi:hypothetical protein